MYRINFHINIKVQMIWGSGRARGGYLNPFSKLKGSVSCSCSKWCVFHVPRAAPQLAVCWKGIQGSPLVTTAFIPAKNCPYKRDVVTSMHFTITNPHLILFGPSKFCRYIQICSYKHGRYKRASLYILETLPRDFQVIRWCCRTEPRNQSSNCKMSSTSLTHRADV